MLLLKNVDLYTPALTGRTDLLVKGGRIIRAEPRIQIPERLCEVFDTTNVIAEPGLIDSHVHILGGGDEGGYTTRMPAALDATEVERMARLAFVSERLMADR